MSKQQYITPSVATTDDRTGYMNTLSTTPGGEVQVVTTGGTVNTIAPDRHIVIGDVLVTPGHYKVIPSDYHIDGNLTIEATTGITIGTETIEYEGHVAIAGSIFNCTGVVDIQGGLSLGTTTFTTAMATSGTSGAYDTDAQAFLTAAGITDGTIAGAVNTLVLTLKEESIWSKLYTFYPMVGGTASTHKYNLKDPQDTDGAYRMTFNGDFTHDATGAAGDGISGYADTHFSVQTFPLGSMSVFFYQKTERTATLPDEVILGTFTSPYAEIGTGIGNTNYFARFGSSYSWNTSNDGNRDGLFIWNRPTETAWDVYRNGSIIHSETGDTMIKSGSDYTMYIWNFNISNPGPYVDSYSPQTLTSIGFAQGLSSGEATALTTAINEFETTLGRNLY